MIKLVIYINVARNRGKSYSVEEDDEHMHKTSKTRYPAHITSTLNRNRKWRLKTIVLTHNHDV